MIDTEEMSEMLKVEEGDSQNHEKRGCAKQFYPRRSVEL